jgi:hypothetical protein
MNSHVTILVCINITSQLIVLLWPIFLYFSHFSEKIHV